MAKHVENVTERSLRDTDSIILNGDVDFHVNPFSDPVRDCSFYYLINAHHERVTATIPDVKGIDRWQIVFDTARGWQPDDHVFVPGDTLELESHSSWLLRAVDCDV